MKKYLKFLKVFLLLILAPLMITSVGSTDATPTEEIGCSLVEANKKSTEDDKIESITADCALSVGGWCICARHLKDNNLRKFSSPLDWMRKYSLDTAAHLFETKFKDFFQDVAITDMRKIRETRTVYDKKNRIESIHYMPHSVPFEQAYKEFKETMSRRAKNVDRVLSSAKSVVLFNCRSTPFYTNTSTDKELKSFAKRFSKAYPNLEKIYLIDIHNNKDPRISKRIIQKDKKVKIIQYSFENISKKFKPKWIGNKVAWNKIMKNIHLSNTIQPEGRLNETKY